MMTQQKQQWRYCNVHGPDFVMCPLVDRRIENIDCIENSDAVDGIVKKETVPVTFKQKSEWEQICKKCKWHGY